MTSVRLLAMVTWLFDEESVDIGAGLEISVVPEVVAVVKDSLAGGETLLLDTSEARAAEVDGAMVEAVVGFVAGAERVALVTSVV